MPAKKNTSPLTGPALLKETCRRIRLARVYWDAHNNRACRAERERALALYDTLTDAQREQIPQILRVWLRYRSEKYFGPDRTKPGSTRKTSRPPKPENAANAPTHKPPATAPDTYAAPSPQPPIP